MPTVVDVPGHGDVEFPDSMSDADVVAAIKKISAPPPQPTWGDRIKEATHRTAGHLPAALGTLGGAIGVGVGSPTVVGSLLLGAGGAGLGAAAGSSLQHAIDSGLGYENPSIMDVTKDAAKTGVAEGALTLGTGALATTIGAAAKPLAKPLNNLGTRLGRRVLNGGVNPLSVREPLSPAAVQEAYQQGAFGPFGTTQSAADTLAQARSTVGDQYGAVVKQLEQSGFEGPEAAALAKEYIQKGATAQANSLNPAVPRVYLSAGKQIDRMAQQAPGSRLPLTRAENLKRSLQDMAESSYKKLEPRALGEAQEDAASMMRQRIEDEVAAQAPKDPEAADAFVPVKRQLGNVIEAAKAAREGAARASNRSPFSLLDLLWGSGGAAHGGTIEGLTSLAGSKLFRTYAPSATTWGLKGAAQGLENAGPLAGFGVVGGSALPNLDPEILNAIARTKALRRMVGEQDDNSNQ